MGLTYKTHFCIVTTSKSKFLSIKEFKMKKRYGAWMGCQIAVEKGLGNSVSDLNDIKLTGDITDLWFITRKRTFELKGVDIPAFLNLKKENRKGSGHVHEYTVSRVWDCWVSVCSC